jgi:hypothetical protein
MTQKRTKLALVPLDERPVNVRYPEMVAGIAGVELLLPPSQIRGEKRIPADRDTVAAWLHSVESECAAAIVSCDYLGYGNLINARISDDSAVEVIARLVPLAQLKIPVYAFSLITRVSNADDNIEEPLYWIDWGTKFYKYSALTHREMVGVEIDDDERKSYQSLNQSLPAKEKADWLVRRLRNHTVNLALIDLAARGKIESLLLTSDDTAAWGLPSRERSWIKSWCHLIPEMNERISMHPGADEVGTALVAKLINQSYGKKPAVWIDYAIQEDRERVAPYEDRPVKETIIGQIGACGAELATDAAEADLILGVLTPSPNGKDYNPNYLDSDRESRTRPYRQLFDRLSRFDSNGIPVMLADVAYPNGADPLAMEILLNCESPLHIGNLAAYGAWNTAGNTLGVVIAQGVSAACINGIEDRLLAQRTFLAHRFVEDWGYQSIVRREARTYAIEKWGRQEPDPYNREEQSEICLFIEKRLSQILLELNKHGVGPGLTILPNSTRLPWKRTFEVDFVLTQA